jgi:hypothetical protein
MIEEILPCPFCNAGETRVDETHLPGVVMSGKPRALVSVTVRHWCGPLPGVVGSHIEYRGRDHASAVAAWNRRTPA